MNKNDEDSCSWRERLVELLGEIIKLLETMEECHSLSCKERLMDNQDVCQLLHVSKRTLQRYRDSGELPFHTIYHKTYYREQDVEAFVRLNFEKRKKAGGICKTPQRNPPTP
jgi:hypothetical protein